MKNKLINTIRSSRIGHELDYNISQWCDDSSIQYWIKNYFDNTIGGQIDNDIYLRVYRQLQLEYDHQVRQKLLGK